MSYTAPNLQSTGDLITASIWNIVVNAIAFLKAAVDGSSNPIFPTQRVFTTSTGLVVGDMVIFCNSTSALTASLPAASACPFGKVIVIKNINTGAVTVNVAGGACSIDGQASQSIPVQYMSLTFWGDAANWYLI